ncbi:MAG: T9SS type A sorting domain-containing protein [Flavobacteriales bacterium]|nr:T9SS type A sorting domain-containing protein [Flavobacteriales bacterium]
MRNKYLLLSFLMISTGSILAQDVKNIAPSFQAENQEQFITKDHGASRYHSSSQLLNLSMVNELWSSDFSNSGQWSINNGSSEGWSVESSVTVWFYNAFGSGSGAPFAQMDNGDATAGGTTAAEHTMQNDTAIDVSGVAGGAIVSFQQRTSRFFDSYYIEASNDGSNWEIVGVNDHVHPRTASNNTPGTPNPEYVAYYIPSTVTGTGNNDLYIRFRWVDDNSGIAYGWLIDDVVVYEAPTNDLDLARAYNFGATDSAAYMLYSRIPLKQAEASTFRPAAAVISNGTATQSDVQVTVTESNTGYSSTSSTFSLNEGEFAIVETADDLVLSGPGNYSVTYSTASSNADALSDNDEMDWDFQVTDNIYGYDDNEAQGQSWFGSAGYTQCLYFDNFTNDTVVGVDVMFPLFNGANGDYGLTFGQTVGASIWDNTLENELASNGFYTVDFGTSGNYVDDWITIPMEYALDPGTVDSYYACFKVYDDEIPYAYDFGVSGFSFVDPDNAGEWFNPVSFFHHDTLNLTPYIRMRMYDYQKCANTNIVIDGTVNDIKPDEWDADITITVLTGGDGPYTFAWSGPGGFISTDQDLSGLTLKGDYVLTVTDVNGCDQSITFTVDGIVGQNAIENVAFDVFPNPAKDFVNVSVAEAGNYTIEVSNLKGELVSSEIVAVGAGETRTINVESLSTGVYMIKVVGENTSSVKEIIVE